MAVLAQDLRDAVLQAAMQGKLTEQLDSDININILYQKIKDKEKDLINKKLIKRTVAEEISDNEILFDIPDTWKLVRLNEIGEIVGGGTPKTTNESYWKDGTITWITPADMNGCGMYIENGAKNITEKGLLGSSAKLFPAGSVIISSRAPIGYITISKSSASTSQGCKTFSAFDQKLVDSKYIYYAMKYRTPDLILRASGTTFKEISGKGIGNTVIPLPPIEEQQRIVDKVEELMKKIDEYEKIENQLEELKKEFPNDIKNAILQAAMQGKLTEQLDSDSSVDEFINNSNEQKKILIKSKKIKNVVVKDVTEDDELFELPPNWRWVRFGNIANLRIGKTPPRSESKYWGTDYKWVSIADMIDSGYISNTKEGISEYGFKNKFNNEISPSGTLIMSFKLTIGRVSILYVPALHNEAIISIFPYNDTDNILRNYLFKTLTFLSKYGDSKSAIKGSTLNSKSLNNLLIPLPPIEEQQRIVEKLDKLLPICEELKEK